MSSASAKRPGNAASWFPGHMAAGMRAVVELASLVDAVVEVRDARLPVTTAVASLHARLRMKPTFVALNKQDLADPKASRAWLQELSQDGLSAFAITATHAATLRSLRAALAAPRGRGGRTRVAVVGAPNTGKSSVINALGRRKRAVTENRAGVTKHVRWIAVDERIDLLDTPGVLEPRIVDATAAWQLALCGILPESAFDAQAAIGSFVAWVQRCKPDAGRDLTLATYARKRGMLRRGGEIDDANAARAYLKDFQAGRLGRFTFELPGAGR